MDFSILSMKVVNKECYYIPLCIEGNDYADRLSEGKILKKRY